MQKRRILLFLLMAFNISVLFAQEIITADRYLGMVSDQYAQIRDFEANITIRSGNSDMTGIISHLSPSFIRIDFSRPADQVIVFNGELLTVYLPDFRVTLSQSINRRSSSTQGLSMLTRNYIAAFVTDPTPVPLEANSREMVVKLRLTRKSISEGFREIIVSVNPETKLIRRMEGRTIADTEVRFDFVNIRTNSGIPEQRFIYDAPPSANVHHNFLFRDNE